METKQELVSDINYEGTLEEGINNRISNLILICLSFKDQELILFMDHCMHRVSGSS